MLSSILTVNICRKEGERRTSEASKRHRISPGLWHCWRDSRIAITHHVGDGSENLVHFADLRNVLEVDGRVEIRHLQQAAFLLLAASSWAFCAAARVLHSLAHEHDPSPGPGSRCLFRQQRLADHLSFAAVHELPSGCHHAKAAVSVVSDQQRVRANGLPMRPKHSNYCFSVLLVIEKLYVGKHSRKTDSGGPSSYQLPPRPPLLPPLLPPLPPLLPLPLPPPISQ
jgi:hypothetical protein